jgi:hypothetical protein
LELGVLKATSWATPADRILTPTRTQSDVGRAATRQQEAVDAKSRFKKKLAVAKALNSIPTAPTGHIYKKGAFKQQLDELFPPAVK